MQDAAWASYCGRTCHLLWIHIGPAAVPASHEPRDRRTIMAERGVEFVAALGDADDYRQM